LETYVPKIEELKNIPICDLFYRVVFDTLGPLMTIKASKKYVLMAIDHYFKWCEAKPIKEHPIETITNFLDFLIFFASLGFQSMCLLTMVENGW
jgi:hypothetical protein